MSKSCEPPFFSPDDCYECVDEWYFSFAEDMREEFLDETLNPFIDKKLELITTEKDSKIRALLIDELSLDMKEMLTEFNIVLANMREIGSEFDKEYQAKLKACEIVRPLVRRSTTKRNPKNYSY